MYSILIAEDEKLERDVIKHLIQENALDLRVFEAGNGKQAYEIMTSESIDILLTDIQMPFMNGLELAEKARERCPNTALIFFSSHSDFQYVKKALSLQAVNYITKPVDPDEFRRTLSDVIARLQNQKLQLTEKRKRLHELHTHILYKLINKTPLSYLMAFYPQVDFSFVHKIHRLLFVQLERDYFNEIDSEDTIATADQFVRLLPSNSYFVNLNPAQSVLLIADGEHRYAWYKELAANVSRYLSDHYQLTCYIEISQPIASADSLAAECEETERKLAEYLFSSALPFPQEEINEIVALDETALNLLRSDIQLKDTMRLNTHMGQILHCLKDSSRNSQLYTRFFCTTILKILLDELPQEKRGQFDEYAAVVTYAVRITPIESMLLSLTKEVSDLFRLNEKSTSQAMYLTKQYIHNHYSEDLSLEILAGKVYLSPNHLSKLFIKQNGYGINKYIKKVRMEKARELLLNTNLPISEIAKQIGYSSASYFCKSFAKDYEISPEKFRNEAYT